MSMKLTSGEFLNKIKISDLFDQSTLVQVIAYIAARHQTSTWSVVDRCLLCCMASSGYNVLSKK